MNNQLEPAESLSFDLGVKRKKKKCEAKANQTALKNPTI